MADDLAVKPQRTRFSPVSWPAILASLAVSVSVMLVMTLAGVALGISTSDANLGGEPAITLAAAIWQASSMLAAAVLGGYVAARLSGMRRTADGVLHGAVAWGAATLLYAALATTALGTLTAGMFGLLTTDAEEPTQSSPAVTGDRDQAQQILERIGLTREQARSVADELAAGAVSDQAPVSGDGEKGRGFGTATAWLAATVLLSLVLSAAGGAIGSRGVRRLDRRAAERHAASVPTSETPAATLSKQT